MADFPYTSNTARIKTLFEKVKSSGVPDKITLKLLSAWGFKSKNDRPFLPILKFIGFVDSSGAPTELYKAFRSDKTGPAVLAQALRQSYATLFHLYPDAYQKDNEALRHFFSSNTTVGANTLEFMVRTFKTLCENANFEVEEVTLPPPNASLTPGPVARNLTTQGSSGYTINVNIQLTLPATDNPTIYENLFAAMKKHILS
jgi:hypothetical protein